MSNTQTTPTWSKVYEAHIKSGGSKEGACHMADEAIKSKTTELQQACIDLNAAIDEYWMADHGIKFTGMVEQFIVKITNAQQKCKSALEAEGISLGNNL